ncbi:MAG: manganese efflux pump MntP, partial [Janthinobacterium lividum]
MNIASTLLLALAMSTDAFAAAVGKGAALRKPRLREAFKAGVIFGVIEAITPLVGWGLGHAAAPYVMSWDHWLAFGL